DSADSNSDFRVKLFQGDTTSRQRPVDRILESVKLKTQLDSATLGCFINQMIRGHSSPGNLLRENCYAEKSETNGVHDATFSLPILPEDVVLAGNKVEPSMRKRSEIIEF